MRFHNSLKPISFVFLILNTAGLGSRIHLKTSRKKLCRIILELRIWLKEHSSKRLKWVMGMVKVKLRGLYNYIGVAGNSASLIEFLLSLQKDFISAP